MCIRDRHQLAGLLGEGRRIGCRILDDRHDLHAVDAAGGVDLLDRHDRRLVQRLLDDGGSAGEREEDADLDLPALGIGCLLYTSRCV